MEDLMNGMETTMDEIQYIVVKLGNEKYGKYRKNAAYDKSSKVTVILYWCD